MKHLNVTRRKILEFKSPSKTLSNYLGVLKPYAVGVFKFNLDRLNPGSEPMRVLIDGDSTAAGFGATKLESTISVLISREFKYVPMEVFNISEKGLRVADLYRKKIPKLENRTKFDLSIIIVGANDVFENRKPERSAASMRMVIKKHLATSKRVLFIGPARVHVLKGIKDEVKEHYERLGINFGKAFRQTAEKFDKSQVSYVDPHDVFNPFYAYGKDVVINHMQATDDFHPNDLAYEIYLMDLVEIGLNNFDFLQFTNKKKFIGKRFFPGEKLSA